MADAAQSTVADAIRNGTTLDNSGEILQAIGRLTAQVANLESEARNLRLEIREIKTEIHDVKAKCFELEMEVAKLSTVERVPAATTLIGLQAQQPWLLPVMLILAAVLFGSGHLLEALSR